MAANCKGWNCIMKKNDWSKLKSISSLVYSLIINGEIFSYNDGQYHLDGGCYMNIDSYTTKYRSNSKFEAHKKYIDVQLIVSGEEYIVVENAKNLIAIDEYDDNKDIVFFADNNKGTLFPLFKNDFLILESCDAHMPCIAINEQKNVKKIVFKIPKNG